MSVFRPMLATAVELPQIRYPLYASPKLDGVRGVVIDGQLRSRSLKPIPNRHVSEMFSCSEFNGLDGELISGSPTAKDVYRVTNGDCQRESGEPDVKMYVFDLHDCAPGTPFEARLRRLQTLCGGLDTIVVVPQYRVSSEAGLLRLEREHLEAGYEGLILRSPDGPYKFGRSTVREGWMLKLKRFADSEAEILEVIEEMENTNVKKTNELGRGQRSSHQAGLVPKGRAGALRVRDVASNVEFSIGTGLNDTDRDFYWQHRDRVRGGFVKYKSFLIGVKDAPRFPVYLGPRAAWDMS